MPSPGLLTDRHELESLFDELAAELDRLGVETEIVMVGGAWMLWHTQRVATRDIDSARRFATDLTEAIHRVGARHDLSPRWLNDDAAAFWPAGKSFADCTVVYQRDSLVVRTPSPEIIFVMKLYRADPQDREDMIMLWSLCSFDTPEHAATAYRDGYPHAPDDEHLGDFIRAIARDAARPEDPRA